MDKLKSKIAALMNMSKSNENGPLCSLETISIFLRFRLYKSGLLINSINNIWQKFYNFLFSISIQQPFSELNEFQARIMVGVERYF